MKNSLFFKKSAKFILAYSLFILHFSLSYGSILNANFGYSPDSGYCPPIYVSFYDSSAPNATSWLWRFGDGTTSDSENPVHVYYYPGNYTVTHIVSDKFGDIDSVTKINAIKITGTDARFKLSSHKICSGDSVYFSQIANDTNPGEWELGNGQIRVGGNNFWQAYTCVSNSSDPLLTVFQVSLEKKDGNCYAYSDDTILVYPVLNPKITRNGDTLVSSFAVKNQWYYNGKAIDTSSSIIIHNKNGVYTLTQTNDGGCSGTDSFVLYDTLRGTITTSKGAALKNQWVYELVYNASDSVLSPVDSIKTDTGGHYVFYTNDTAVYLVAVPDSANYPNEMGTYYDSALIFQSASVIHPKLGTTVINFNTIGGTNSSGGSFIGGTITICNCKKPGKGQPVPNLRVILVDNNNNPVRQTITNKYGAFAFGSLAKGTYKIWVDYPHFDNSLAPVINLPANTTIKKDLLFLLYPTYLQLDTTTTSINQVANSATNLTVYPNPFTSAITISYTLPQNQNVLLTLTDITGKQIATLANETQNPGQHIYTFDADKYNIPAGMYFIKLVAGNEAIEQKIVRIR